MNGTALYEAVTVIFIAQVCECACACVCARAYVCARSRACVRTCAPVCARAHRHDKARSARTLPMACLILSGLLLVWPLVLPPPNPTRPGRCSLSPLQGGIPYMHA